MESSDQEQEEHPLTLKSSLEKSVRKLVQNKVILLKQFPAAAAAAGEGRSAIQINTEFSLPALPDHVHSAIRVGHNLKSLRKEHERAFWSANSSATKNGIDRIWIDHNHDLHDKEATMKHKKENHLYLTPLQLKERYLYMNRPCIIQNMSIPITDQWIIKNDKEGTKGKAHINTQWFLDNVGPETKVPVRVNQPGYQDGRAAECLTSKITMKEWIEEVNSQNPDPNHYLKDWHMQSRFKHLYSDPIIFQDVLNPFLIENEGGDYRFVYWGCKGSSTGIHSDVLNTFSWSYNVIGTKRWTFYHMDDIHGSGSESLVVDQCQGEMLYVPSGWRHSVENLEEAISVNHNWTMTGSLDCIFDCVVDEIRAVEEEMDAWGMTNPSAENDKLSRVREDMLRGCVGMDVSMFCALVVSCFTKCLLELINDDCSGNERERDAWLDFYRIALILGTILDTTMFDEQEEYVNDADKNGEEMVVIDLQGRLKSTLGEKHAQDTMELMQCLYDFACQATNDCTKEM